MSGDEGENAAVELALDTEAVRLTEIGVALLADCRCEQLHEGLRRCVDALGRLGPRFTAPAAGLTRRDEYLTDASGLLLEALTRLGVARAAPAESDVGVHLARTREAIGYLAEIVADLIPPGACRALGPDVVERIAEDLQAPGLAVELVPVLTGLLVRLRGICNLAEAMDHAIAVQLGQPRPPDDPARACGGARRRRVEIDGLLAALEAWRTKLGAQPVQGLAARDRALRDGLGLTPSQFRAVLTTAGLPDPG